MRIEPGAVTLDKHTSPHGFGETQRLHTYPFFFWQSPNGSIVEVHYG